MEIIRSMLVSLCICLIFCGFSTTVQAIREKLAESGENVFNVKDFGAKGSPSSDDTQAFLDAWSSACGAFGVSTFLVPKGTFYLSHLGLSGPCPAVTKFIFQVEGTLKASTDMKKFPNGKAWVVFTWVNSLTLTGGGVFDGQGATAWPTNTCANEMKCKVLPASIKFVRTNGTVLDGITSLDSKYHHISLESCYNFMAKSITITAPGDSPATDGFRIEKSEGVTISNSQIGTGDDCVSIGQGTSNVTITNVKCGPGNGITIGSLGRFRFEKDVQLITVKDSTFTGTTHGVQIKTWMNAASSINVTDLTFDNLIMKDVDIPIYVNQSFCPSDACTKDAGVSTGVDLSNVKFSNIRGTANLPEAVSIECIDAFPCRNIILENIDLKSKQGEAKTTCINAKTQFKGNNNPPPCPEFGDAPSGQPQS